MEEMKALGDVLPYMKVRDHRESSKEGRTGRLASGEMQVELGFDPDEEVEYDVVDNGGGVLSIVYWTVDDIKDTDGVDEDRGVSSDLGLDGFDPSSDVGDDDRTWHDTDDDDGDGAPA